MKTYLQKGEILSLAAPEGGVSSGDPVLIGDIFGVAVADAEAGTTMELFTGGVHELPKKDSDEIAVGDLLYFDKVEKELTLTSGANKLVGAAVAAAAETDDLTVKVRLNPGFCAGKAANVLALEDGTITGTADGALELVGATNGGDVSGAINNNFKEVQAKINAILAAMKAASQMAADPEGE